MASALDLTQTAHEHGVVIDVNDVGICVEPFGDPADPAILLIHGGGTSMLGWEAEFCQRMAAGGRFVIRYDQRDTGRSVSYPPGQPDYDMATVVDDVAGLLDVFELTRAHIVGFSMGGSIAMRAALAYPERVASLTLIESSPGGPGLPPMSHEILAMFGDDVQPDWSDHAAVLEYLLEFTRICAGSGDRFDEAEWREMLRIDLARTSNVASSQMNHVAISSKEPIRPRLAEITAPTLVIHGDEDPIFPLAHGEALAREIPGAELLILRGSGHLLTRPAWDRVIPAILRISSTREGEP